jgi:hypothetical protein
MSFPNRREAKGCHSRTAAKQRDVIPEPPRSKAMSFRTAAKQRDVIPNRREAKGCHSEPPRSGGEEPAFRSITSK